MIEIFIARLVPKWKIGLFTRFFLDIITNSFYNSSYKNFVKIYPVYKD